MSNNLIGISFKLINCLLFSILSLVILHCAKNLPVTQILFARVSLGVIICALYLVIIKQKISFRMSGKDLLFYIARAIISFVAMQFWIYAMQYIGITEATALSYTGPFWIFLAARYMIGEAFSLSSFLAIIANMGGVIIILQPNFNNITWQGVAASLSSILLWVLYETICKKQTSNQHYMLQTFYVCFFATIIILPFALFNWQPFDLKTFGILSLIAILGVANVTSIFLAYFFAPMMIISPFSYSRLIFTAFLSAYVYHAMPSINVFIGSAIIMCVNFYFAYKKTNIEKKHNYAKI
jgi:drug/metabolite transporter (DMT)-like permease